MVTSTLRRPVRKADDLLTAILKRLRELMPDLSAERDAIEAELKQAFLDAFRLRAPDVAIDTAMVDRAAEFAKERTSGLIDDLVGTTRDDVQQIIAEGLQHGQSIQWYRDAIRDATCFDQQRAETIGITESAYAIGRGQRAAAESMGQDERKWICEATACEDCAANAESDWISLDEPFGGGDDDIPGHVRCRCDVIYRTSRLYADDTTDEGDAGNDEEKAVRPRIIAEARCPVCRHLEARNVNVGAELNCRKCRKGFRVLTGSPIAV